jgi:hypothetical protein
MNPLRSMNVGPGRPAPAERRITALALHELRPLLRREEHLPVTMSGFCTLPDALPEVHVGEQVFVRFPSLSRS